MIDHGEGNLLDANVEALVNTVNTVGVGGKGIALQFRQAYPENFKAYAQACKRGDVVPGRMFTYDLGRLDLPRYIINFPTKRHWRGKSRIGDIESGLVDLVATIRELGITSIAIPPLGCGNGGLAWTQVRPLIEQALAQVPDVRALVYDPEGAPAQDEMTVRTKRPDLTAMRAAVLALFDEYLLPDYRLSALEAQKLTYFLQACGQPLKLEFVKGQFGPYAEKLNHALQSLEGHYIRGYGDRTQEMQLYLLPGAAEAAQEFLATDPAAGKHVDEAATVVEGFETPYGLELLSTVHWANHDIASTDVDAVTEYVRDWTPRKGSIFTREHVERALKHLARHGLVRTG